MFKAYKYVFYRIYIWSCNAWGEKELPHHNAVLGMVILTLLNLFVILAILQLITGVDFTAFGAYSDKELALPVLCYIAIHYYILFRKKRYKKIIEKYNQKSKEEHKKNTTWVMAYIIGTPILYLIILAVGVFFSKSL